MSDPKRQSEPGGGGMDETNPPGLSGPYYEIHLKDHLDSTWTDWLEGLEVKLLENGETVLAGVIVDQAALMGILNKLIGLNLTLLSVNEIKSK